MKGGDWSVRFDDQTTVPTTASSSPPPSPSLSSLDATMTDASSSAAESCRGLKVDVRPATATSTSSSPGDFHSPIHSSGGSSTDSTSPGSDFSEAWEDEDDVPVDLSASAEAMVIDGDKSSTAISPLRKKSRGKQSSSSSSATKKSAAAANEGNKPSLMSPDGMSVSGRASPESTGKTVVFPPLCGEAPPPVIKPSTTASSFVSSLVSSTLGLPALLLPTPTFAPSLLAVRRKSPRSSSSGGNASAASAAQAPRAPLLLSPPQDDEPASPRPVRFPLSASPPAAEVPSITTFSPGSPPVQIPVDSIIQNGKLIYIVSEKYKT